MLRNIRLRKVLYCLLKDQKLPVVRTCELDWTIPWSDVQSEFSFRTKNFTIVKDGAEAMEIMASSSISTWIASIDQTWMRCYMGNLYFNFAMMIQLFRKWLLISNLLRKLLNIRTEMVETRIYRMDSGLFKMLKRYLEQSFYCYMDIFK